MQTKDLVSTLKRFDAYPKTLEDFRIKTFGGGAEALKHGLLSKAVPEGKLEEEVNLIAEKIVSLSQPVVAMGKSCFYAQVTKTRDQAYIEAESTMVENMELYDGQEGINAFIAKRKPTWKNISDCH